MPEAVRRHINLKIMNKKFNSEKELGFEELEDRLEMAQVAAADSSRCYIGSGSSDKLP
ncbi:hypothetical protein HMPREF6745_1492 [Prevotella sp. oral taxon 472 str. F0295]|nr:hypothetical protein HMPREF6745_1492 [Prevotella sp. oral taxon 472 str. F0295]